MELKLIRESFTNKATEGKLYINGELECYTLEDKDRSLEDGGEKVYGETAIPRGIYTVQLTYSNRFKTILPLLLDVPQFTGIRIHKGNYSKDTDGCILVGAVNTNDKDDFIGSSKVAFDKLFSKMKEAEAIDEKITIEIV